MERRKFMRFPVELKIETGKEDSRNNPGLTKNFSHDGLRGVFEEFDFVLNSPLRLKIQIPNSDIFIPASAEPAWKRLLDGKWNVGFRLKEFPPARKAEILEYGYNNWIKENILSA